MDRAFYSAWQKPLSEGCGACNTGVEKGLVRIPVSTYRLQFNRDFRFVDAIRIVGYLHDLGITDVYASPILKARPGSTHGYDVIDPTQINPEIGTPEEFDQLVSALQAKGIGLILDIVPNHM